MPQISVQPIVMNSNKTMTQSLLSQEIRLDAATPHPSWTYDSWDWEQAGVVLAWTMVLGVDEEISQYGRTDAPSISGKVWEMSKDPLYCHNVQRMLHVSMDWMKVAIAEELRTHICDAVFHPHANFVVQKCVEILKPEACQFIIDELICSGRVQEVAQHKFGCRILQRLIEYCTEQAYELIRVLVVEALVLVKNRYGVFVIQQLLKYACYEQHRSVLDLLIGHASELCSSNISITVVDAILSGGHDADIDAQKIRRGGIVIDETYQIALGRAVLEHQLLPKMACSRQGHTAVRSVLRLFKGSFEYTAAQDQLIAKKEKLIKTRYGRSILREIDKENVTDAYLVSTSLHPAGTPCADTYPDTDDGF